MIWLRNQQYSLQIIHTLYSGDMSSRAIDTSSQFISQQVADWSTPRWHRCRPHVHPGVHPGTMGWTWFAIQTQRAERRDATIPGTHNQVPPCINPLIPPPHQPASTARTAALWVPIFATRSPWRSSSQLLVLCDCNRMDTPVRLRTGKGHLHGQSLGRRMGPPAEAGPPTRLLSNGLGSGSQP